MTTKLLVLMKFAVALIVSHHMWYQVAHAAPLPTTTSHFDAYYVAVLDNPDEILVWATREMQRYQPDQEPKLWVRMLTTRLLAGAFIGNRERYDMLPQIKQAIALSQKQGLLREEFELINIKSELDGKNDSKEDILASLQDIGERMLASADFTLPAVYFRTLSSAMRALGESRLALEYGSKALQLFSSPEQQKHPLYFELKNNVGTQFSDLFQHKKAEELYLEVSAYCEAQKIRHFGSLVTFNLAQLYKGEAFSRDYLPKSAEYYMKSIKMAEEIHHDIDVAFGYRGLASVQAELQNYNESHASFQKAVDIFEKYEEPAIWTVWAGQGMLLVQEKRYKEALAIMEKVLDVRRKQLDMVPLRFFKALAEAYLQLGDFRNSAVYANKHSDGMEKLFKSNKEQELSRLQVQLGLTVEEQKNTSLKRENEIQAERLTESERRRKLYFGFVGLSLLALIMMGIAVGKARQVRSSREKMKLVLDQIKEGILTISTGLKVETSFSPYIKTILGVTLEKEAFEIMLERADLSPDARDSIRQILNACLNEDMIAWEANSSTLPQEITLDNGEKVIELSWQPISQNGFMIKVLLVLRDVTESKRLVEEVQEVQRRTNRLGIKLTEIISSRIPRVRALIEPAARELPGQLENIHKDVKQCLRWLHTLKGSARTLGLQSLSSSCHQAETELKMPPQKTRQGQILAAGLRRDIDEYVAVLERISSADTISSSSGLGDLLDEQMRMMKPQLEAAGISLQGYQLEDRFMQWTPQILQAIAPILVHGMNNAVDHGFILPNKRGRSISSAFFNVAALRKGEFLILTIRDFGAGLDLARIQQIAAGKGFTPAAGQSLTDVLFMDGVSTATEVSLTSGRGVGLAAIKQICDEHQGQVHLQAPQEGQGTVLEISWPIVA